MKSAKLPLAGVQEPVLQRIHQLTASREEFRVFATFWCFEIGFLNRVSYDEFTLRLQQFLTPTAVTKSR